MVTVRSQKLPQHLNGEVVISGNLKRGACTIVMPAQLVKLSTDLIYLLKAF